MSKMQKRIVLGLLCVAVLAVVLGLPAKQKVWEDLPYTQLHFENGRSWSLDAGDNYGEMNAGPGLKLPAGRYRLKWRVAADGENCLILRGKYGLNSDRTEIPLPAGQTEGEAEFELREATAGLDLVFSFEQGTKIEVQDLRLYSPRYRDNAFLLAFICIGICLLIWLRSKGLSPESRNAAVLIGLSVLVACGPAFKDTVGIGHDSIFHLVRLQNLADGLRTMTFPVRLGAFSYNGFGAITSVFYPDFFLLDPALLMVCGCSLPFAVNTYIVELAALSAAAMYLASMRIFRDHWAAAASAILYVLSIYRISDVFTRFALGEMTAMAFLPLFLLGLWEVLLGRKGEWRILAFSAAAICLSHVLSTVLCAVLAAVCCLLGCTRLVKERRIVPLLKAAAGAAALCAFWLIPFVFFSRQGIGAQSLMKDPAYFALHPAQLFLLGQGELAVDPADRALSTFSLEIGLPMLLTSAFVLCAPGKEGVNRSHLRTARILLALGLCCAAAATTLFPWGHVRKLSRGLTDYLQFPWRFLMLTSGLLALCGGWGAARFSGRHGEQMAALLLALSAVCALPTLSREARSDSVIAFGETISPDLAYVEYTLPGTDPKETREPAPRIPEGLIVSEYEKRGSRITAQIRAEQEAVLSLPLYGFDGYAAEADGQKLTVSCGADRRLEVLVPAGTDGRLTVRYAGIPLFRAGDALSLASLLFLTLQGRLKRRRK